MLPEPPHLTLAQLARLPDLPLSVLLNLQVVRLPSGSLRAFCPELNLSFSSENLEVASLLLRWIWLHRLLADSPGGDIGSDRAGSSILLQKAQEDSATASWLTQAERTLN